MKLHNNYRSRITQPMYTIVMWSALDCWQQS